MLYHVTERVKQLARYCISPTSFLDWQASTVGIQCQICRMMFSDQSAISAHYDTAHAQSSGSRPEHPDARHECEVCGRKFTEKHHLRRHLSTVHGVGDFQSFQCNVCSYVSKHKHNLKTHLSRVHGLGGVKTADCEVCSKVFKSKQSLKQHIQRAHSQVTRPIS